MRLAVRAAALTIAVAAAVGLCADETVPRYPDVVVMVVVPERGGGDGLATAETELIRQLTAAGYRVVDQSQVAAVREWGLAERVMRNPSGPEARQLAAQFNAGLLVIGRAEGEAAGRLEGLETARARVELRVIVPATGEVLFADGVTESGADTSRRFAVRKAMELAARRLAPRVLNAVGQATGGPTRSVTGQGEGGSGAEGRGPRRLRVAVAPFDDRSGWTGGNWNLREAIPDLIAQELMKLGIVDVVDRASLDKTLAEQKLDISGLVDRSAEARELGTLQAADVLVIGRVSEFTTKKQTLGGLLPWKGGAALHREKGIVKILLKVVDVKTGRVLGVGEATGEATEASIAGGYAGIIFGGAQFDKSAMGRATRRAVREAVRLIATALARAGVEVGTCPHCGAVTPKRAKFCPQCGKRLKPRDEAQRCGKCGEQLPPGARFCPQCGARVEK